MCRALKKSGCDWNLLAFSFLRSFYSQLPSEDRTHTRRIVRQGVLKCNEAKPAETHVRKKASVSNLKILQNLEDYNMYSI